MLYVSVCVFISANVCVDRCVPMLFRTCVGVVLGDGIFGHGDDGLVFMLVHVS